MKSQLLKNLQELQDLLVAYENKLLTKNEYCETYNAINIKIQNQVVDLIIYKEYKDELGFKIKCSLIDFLHRTEEMGWYKKDTALQTLLMAGIVETPTTQYCVDSDVA